MDRAAYNGHKEIAAVLVSNGANTEAKNISSGYTPLHIAAEKGHMETAALLVSHGANIEAKNNDGKTPLDLLKSSQNRSEWENIFKDSKLKSVKAVETKKLDQAALPVRKEDSSVSSPDVDSSSKGIDETDTSR